MHIQRTSPKSLVPALALAALSLLAGCGGGGSSSPATAYAVGAKISENGTVGVANVFLPSPPSDHATRVVSLKGESGRTYFGNIPTDLQTNGQRVHFTATVTEITDPNGDGLGDYIDITEIHAIASK